MSEKHLYEKHLAEKLQQLSPPPDMEQHWQEMKVMLDDDRPRGGGFGKRWWRIGVIAGLLLIGGWITGTFLWTNEADKLVADRPNSANVEEKKLSPGDTAPPTDNGIANNGKGNTPDGGAADGRSAGKGDADNQVADKRATDGANGEAGAVSKSGVARSNPVDAPGPEKNSLARNRETGTDRSVGSAPVKGETGDGFSTNNRSKADNKPSAKPTETLASAQGAGNKIRDKAPYSSNVGSDDRAARNNPERTNSKQYNTKDDLTVLRNNKTPNQTNAKPVDYSPVRENINYTGSLTLAPGENVKKDFSSLNLKTKETLRSKSARSGKSGQAKSFAFGFSLPLAFPLGDQKALSYNFNAGANTVSDYLPSPHVQYRLNDKTYLQTELQFIAPQYIRPILLYENRMQASGNYMVYNSIYARKLYYFNLPIGIHHSPFQNFYLGTGLQFSSLLSGVGLYEETKRTMNGQPISLLSERYARLSGDSLSNRMNRGEVRLMLEANYYVNRFTFGLRYNQAFNNYVNFRIDNMSPYTFDKNKALQFYLRYNLWEDVRRRNNGKGSLSSK